MSLQVIRFSASWCSPCGLMGKVMERVSPQFSDVEFQTVDIDEDNDLASTMKVRAVPTLAFVKNGTLVDTLVGLQKEDVVVKTINKWRQDD